MENVSRLLSEVQDILKFNRRVDYNIFSAIGLKSKETIHSSILASFLDPSARHGLGSTFLSLFIEQINELHDFNFNASDAKVETEKSAPAEGVNGRIDIFISSEDLEKETIKKALIIENKLNAGDQDRQLIRYAAWANENKYDYKILYLTLDKHEARSYSTTGKEICISYCDHILPWLEKCIEKAALAPDVREPLNQYHIYITNLIKQIIMDRKIAENILAAEKIKNSYYNGLAIAANKFVVVLKEDFEKMNYEYKIDVEYNEGKHKDYQFWAINIKKQGWSNMRIRFQYDSKNFENLHYGIFFYLSDEGIVLAEHKEKILSIAENSIQDIRKIKPFLSNAKPREGKNNDRWPFKVACDGEFKNLLAEHVASPKSSAFRVFIMNCVDKISPFVDEYESIK